MNPFEQESKFEEAWIHELLREHEVICWSYGVNLRTPMIEITSAVRQWGAWDPASRTIRISGNLIREHSWDVTLNVFKHEMAHQIVTDRFGVVDAHGPVFQQACAMIGVPGPFRKSSGDTSEIIEEIDARAAMQENNRMLEKVRKLLSLARSANENEALLAMQKANQLIEKYNIERIEENRKEGFVYAIINHKRKRIENYQRRICLILQEHFFVDVVYANLYDPIARETHRTIELLGTSENVRIAEYVYHFLMNQMEILWKSHRRRKTTTLPKNKRSYRLGVLEGFHGKLDEQAAGRINRYRPEAGSANSISALILAEDLALKEFTRMRFPRLWTTRTAGAHIDRGTFQAGLDDGKRLNLHKGVHGHDGNNGKLIAGPTGKKTS
ncbi:MAG: DUF2786 domain-containing protein [Desulfatiglandaceae bacterium]